MRDTRVCGSDQIGVHGGTDIETTLWDQGVVSSSLAAPTFDCFRICERHRRVTAALCITRKNITHPGGLEQPSWETRVSYVTGSEIAPGAPLQGCMHTTELMP
jgi:hypothetical protein